MKPNVRDITNPTPLPVPRRDRSEDFARASEQWHSMIREIEAVSQERDKFERMYLAKEAELNQMVKLLESEREFYAHERERAETYLRTVTAERDRYRTLWATLKGTLETAVEGFDNTLRAALNSAVGAMGRMVAEAKGLSLETTPPPAISDATQRGLQAIEEVINGFEDKSKS